jgi:hypothetical protein
MESSLLLSWGAFFTVIGLAIKVGNDMGQMREFKKNIEQRTAEVTKEADAFVRRVEMNTISRHIDQRFDAFERQMQELRSEITMLRSA